jgi:hypothetical protein
MKTFDNTKHVLGGMIMKRRTKGKKKIAFSKIIFVGVSIMTISVVIFSCRMIYMTGDLSPLAYLIPSIFAELATATGFYYKKAEKENTKGGIIYDSAMAEQEYNEEYSE